MIASHIHHALAQVRELKRRVVESRRFRGYSGKARLFSGVVALLAAMVMSSNRFPETFYAHVLGWASVFMVAFLANYGALLLWFLSEPRENRDKRQLLPVVDPLLPIFVGGVLTLAVILNGHYDYLFGIWMCLFGLANLASRWVLPRSIWPLGLFFIAAGTACLLVPGISFLNPWPMGLVFFVGESLGGILFIMNRDPNLNIRNFLSLWKKKKSASNGE